MNNLKAEMARYGITNIDLAHLLNVSEKTVRNKISGETDFSFHEVVKIRNTYFRGMTLEYLFGNDEEATREAI